MVELLQAVEQACNKVVPELADTHKPVPVDIGNKALSVAHTVLFALELHQVQLLTDCVHQFLPHYSSVVAVAVSLASCKDWGDLEFASYYLFLSINK